MVVVVVMVLWQWPASVVKVVTEVILVVILVVYGACLFTVCSIIKELGMIFQLVSFCHPGDSSLCALLKFIVTGILCHIVGPG